MSIDRVKEFFQKHGRAAEVLEFDVSSATVELAAQALEVIPARIAKTLAFQMEQGCILVVMAGDAKVDNRKFKERFACKAKLLAPADVLAYTGHAVGGTCPFALANPLPVYLDRSLQRFETVYPACGSSNSAICLTPKELFVYSEAKEWVDVGKGWEAGE